MPYQVKCDGFPILDVRDDELMVFNPKVDLEVNTVGSASFTIYKDHPYYGNMHKLRSIFEVSDEIGCVFRGRMTGDTINFDNGKDVVLEGLMAFFNDSVVRPFNFPEDFLEDADYIAAADDGNVVEFFLNWLITNHNNQVQDFQKFKLGTVTVSDPNNYITRSRTDYSSTWDTLKSKLFDSSHGGYLCIRYEDDGNYIDYLSKFVLTNTQEITFGENLLDLSNETDANATYSAIIPIGAEIETTTENEDETSTPTKTKLTLEGLADGDITDDIVKQGDMLYSKRAVENYGFICAPVKDTTWDDVTNVDNLLTKSVDFLVNTAVMLANTVETTAVDLHYTDEEIRSFRLYRNTVCHSKPHGITMTKPLTKLGLDLMNPQNTKITLGETRLTMTDVNGQQQSGTIQRIESVKKDIEENRTNVTEVKNQVIIQSTELINTCNQIILGALESYVETSNFEEYRETVSSQLKIMADEILMNFTTTTEQITNVDGDLQKKFTELYSYISFAGGNIALGSSENLITLTIEHDLIVFKRNGVAFGSWDGENLYTGNIIIRLNERFQLGNFARVPRTDGSVVLLKVGVF